jgi:metacaspase-1
MVKRAVLIGINYNNINDLKLNGCINDIIVMRNVLVDAYGYNRKDVTMLRDDGAGYLLPTRENILGAIASVAELTSVGDEMWIHYSGHGTYVRDTDGDEVDKYDEVIIPVDYVSNGLIVDEELKSKLENVLGHVIITQDCCNSGTGWDLPYRFTLDSSDRVLLYRESSTLKNNNIYMFSGSRDEQFAADTYDGDIARNVGAFTNAFIECLRSGNHNNNLISLRTNVNNYLEDKGYTQRSEFTSTNSSPHNIMLTRNGIVDDGPSIFNRKTFSSRPGLMFL